MSDTATRYSGVFPILPTTFDEQGNLDEASQLRAVDFFIAAGVDGFCVLANFSEQFALSDAERERITQLVLDHVQKRAARRVPVIVTTSHYSARVAAERSQRAEDAGAAMVMLMPPYHGTLRPGIDGVYSFFKTVSGAIRIPIMIQDAPLSGTVLPAALLARLVRELDRVRYFKIESVDTTTKIRALVGLVGNTANVFDGEEGITLIPDLDAGATGTMPGGMTPELYSQVLELHRAGRRAEAIAAYNRLLPLINYENHLAGLRATKILMKEAGIIRSDAVREPASAPMTPEIRAGLLEILRSLDPFAYRFK